MVAGQAGVLGTPHRDTSIQSQAAALARHPCPVCARCRLHLFTTFLSLIFRAGAQNRRSSALLRIATVRPLSPKE